VQDPHALGSRLALCSTRHVPSISAQVCFGLLASSERWMTATKLQLHGRGCWLCLPSRPSGFELQLTHLSCCKRGACSGSDPFAYMRKRGYSLSGIDEVPIARADGAHYTRLQVAGLTLEAIGLLLYAGSVRCTSNNASMPAHLQS